MLSKFQCNFYAKILVARGFCVEVFEHHILVNNVEYSNVQLIEQLVDTHPRLDIVRY